MPRREFYARIQEFIHMVKSSRTRPDVTEILLPGELEWRRMQGKRRTGVAIDPVIYEELRQLAADHQLAWPFNE